MSVLVVPSSTIPLVTLLQFSELTLLVFCCRFQPVEGDGQETATVLVVVWKTDNQGAPGVGTAAMMPQKPPSRV